MLYRLIHAEKANYPIVLLCRVLRVARSSYYAWREGEAARQARRAADDALAHEIPSSSSPPSTWPTAEAVWSPDA